jgi:hypothetical protein
MSEIVRFSLKTVTIVHKGRGRGGPKIGFSRLKTIKLIKLIQNSLENILFPLNHQIFELKGFCRKYT